MTGPADSREMTPFFLAGAEGPLYCIHHPVPRGTTARGALLFVPPFAEEMNRSRRMIALQARRLAGLGYHVLQLDLYGTGDSAGDFAEARWDAWLEDVRRARRWLEERTGQSVVLWGLRSGCLLAAEIASEGQGALGGLLLWQPVANGQVYLTQFLRIKIAAAMADREGESGKGPSTKAPSTKVLRQSLLGGESLEVAGYELSPDLARGLDNARLSQLVPPTGTEVVWLEIGQEDDAALSPANQAVVETWQGAGAEVQAATLSGPSFWAIEDTTLVPRLWDKTEEALLA